MKTLSPQEVLAAMVAKAGSQKRVANDLGISASYCNDLLTGRRTFSVVMLAKLGLQAVIIKARETGQ